MNSKFVILVVILSVLALSEAGRGKRGRGNGGKNAITWYGPVTSEAECGPGGKPDSLTVSGIKERKPKELCQDSTTPLCVCQSLSGKLARRMARNGQEPGYKMRCAPCDFSWNWRQFKRSDNENNNDV
ncbi:hypothetical protein TCAL_09731 [Tigriopus californicus]|uniref:Thyroglobulin type-1 domain-containing protein n=1 Tax=Tigriopus californicus TaxID=6832 RepID=A0A553NV61_TIGCA|nr:uncharacterized protein LOC131877145 [Tigriopus californicus]TRY69310.1 hypothetical protein TCAL_09731 [Tigriopus californicus]|eukprot:TCALIF_09731-PA protein Name:"Protein of unknown function" AED:0.10 eAED:0.10 QI:105/1/1/1/1/1/2/124/127